MSLVRLHSIIIHAHQVRRIVGPVPAVVRHVVASLILHLCILISYVLSVMRVVLRVLLTINERHTIDVIVLVIVVFVSSHD